jgi:hypothetical protein
MNMLCYSAFLGDNTTKAKLKSWFMSLRVQRGNRELYSAKMQDGLARFAIATLVPCRQAGSLAMTRSSVHLFCFSKAITHF